MKTSLTQNIFRVILGLFFIYAGISHISFKREEFSLLVPGYIPVNADLIVLISGYIEIILGLLVVFCTKIKKKLGIIITIFLILVFWGNLFQYLNKIDAFGLNSDKLRFIRLLFQPLLILWTLWCTSVFSKKKRLE